MRVKGPHPITPKYNLPMQWIQSQTRKQIITRKFVGVRLYQGWLINTWNCKVSKSIINQTTNIIENLQWQKPEVRQFRTILTFNLEITMPLHTHPVNQVMVFSYPFQFQQGTQMRDKMNFLNFLHCQTVEVYSPAEHLQHCCDTNGKQMAPWDPKTQLWHLIFKWRRIRLIVVATIKISKSSKYILKNNKS